MTAIERLAIHYVWLFERLRLSHDETDASTIIAREFELDSAHEALVDACLLVLLGGDVD